MSDYLSQGTFDIIWDGLVSTNTESEESMEIALNHPVTEVTHEEFLKMLGVEITEFDDEIEESTTVDRSILPLPVTEKEEPATASKDCFEDLSMNDVRSKIQEEENRNTPKKTLQDISKFRRFLGSKKETRDIHVIPPEELDELLANYILSVRKLDGSEYEPTTIRNMVSSIDRHLKRHKYPVKIMQESATNFFQLSRDALGAKQKSLKKMGKGNRPNAADPISDEEIEILYERKILGKHSPKSLINTIWLNNCIMFGLRGTTENYNMRWGDVQLKTANDGAEYLEFNERQTKTRTGCDLSDVRKVRPKVWAKLCDPDRCPVELYKLYSSKRPFNFLNAEHPFYLAPRTTPLSNESDQWFLKMRLGEKKLSSMLKSMCSEGGLNPNKNLTNHATRKHLISKLRDSGVAPTDIMQISGHKNLQSILNYSTMSEEKHKEISSILSETRSNKSSHTITNPESSINIHDNHSNTPAPTCINDNQQLDLTSLPNVSESNPTHLSHSSISNVNVGHSTSDLTSLFGGATLNITNFNVYMR